ncbi:hypothetical protein [Paraburkholderia sp. 40]|uniref:hypothetical protein n=1 Tax=Paraburkholderia sp. 40 TaxID=2991059 RepID=UPI003D19B9E0
MAQTKTFSFQNAILLLATIPIAAWFSWKNRHYQLDDSLIYLRYLRNLFNGYGLTYNAGDRFNGLTSPLYSYLLIVANAVTHNLQYTTIFLSFVFLCAAAIYGAITFSDNPWERVLCAFFVVSFNYFYTTFGMETMLFLFLYAVTIWFYKNERYYLFGAAIGLLVLTRTEGVFLAAITIAHYVYVHRKLPPLKYAILPVAFVAANLLFNYIYYGAPLPATGNAKIGQGRSGLWGTGLPFLNVGYMKGWFFDDNLKLLAFMIVGTVIGLWAKRREINTRLFVCSLALLACFYVFMLIPNYHWYDAPFFYFLMIFSAIGAFQVLSFAIRRVRRNALYTLVAIPTLVATVAFGAENLKLSNISRGPLDWYKNIGEWITQNTPEQSVVAAVEIGTVGWYANRHIIDILGLTNPYNADYIANKDVHSWLTRYFPDYILVHDPLWVFETTADCLEKSGAYAPTPNFNFQGYRLLERSKAPNTATLAEACGRTGQFTAK